MIKIVCSFLYEIKKKSWTLLLIKPGGEQYGPWVLVTAEIDQVNLI